MRVVALAVAWLLSASASIAGQTIATVDPLSRARQAYNTQQIDEAIRLAEEAAGIARLAVSASVVRARALLERYRRAGDVADVASARQALLSVDPARLAPNERAEYRLGTAELLFIDEQFGAATEIFEAALRETIDVSARDRVLDWWASSVDRHAQLAPDTERHRRYQRLLDRMQDEASNVPASPVAAYWLAAAYRGVEDLDRAWSVAVAAWIQAPATTSGASTVTLRADLDRLMREAIIPERARQAAPPPGDPEALRVALAAEWEAIKKRWTR